MSNNQQTDNSNKPQASEIDLYVLTEAERNARELKSSDVYFFNKKNNHTSKNECFTCCFLCYTLIRV